MFTPTRHRIVVAGNGPSLRGFDFRTLTEVDSLGMNAAYRHWERIGWYPTHYACLDDQLIETHAAAIHDMIVTGKVRTAFLIAKILEFHPELAKRDNVFFLESFNKTRHARVAHLGVKHMASLPFRESDPSKVTTGSYATRYAAHLGYREIALIGIDLRYIEIIPEARQADGIKLVMEKTPQQNPNYFFDDYQRAGDKFNIPNPAAHEKNLHVAAFEAMAVDVARFGWQASVLNANRQSVLFDKAIFPYVDIERFARRRALGMVVVPTTAAEEPQILQNLQAWEEPRLAPSIRCASEDRPDLIFAFSGAPDEALRARLLEAYARTSRLRKCFANVDVQFVGLDASLDYYRRDYRGQVSGRGFKSGPNEQFFRLMRMLAGSAEFVFYMETDCVPLRQGWLDRLRELAEGDAESWVIGSLYRGREPISDRFFLHLNGNALYRVGDREFIRFVETYWRPWLNRLLDTSDRRLAYDCLLSHRFTAAQPTIDNEPWREFQGLAQRFRATSVIQNISGVADQRGDAAAQLRTLLQAEPALHVVHGRHFARLLHDGVAAAAARHDPFSWSDALGMQAALKLEPLRWTDSVARSLPRLLALDPTPTGSGSATGQLKQVLLDGWPADRLLQVYQAAGELRLQRFGTQEASPTSEAGLLRACREFAPDVIYFRPVDTVQLWQFAEALRAQVRAGWVLHIMDDWPERLRLDDPDRFTQIDPALRAYISSAHECLAIGSAMAEAYEQRYGRRFLPVANGVDTSTQPFKDWTASRPWTAERPFVLRYLGGLARDMGRESVLDVARAVSSLASTLPLRFEIYTMDWYLEDAREAVAGLAGISVQPLVPAERYPGLLAEADALLIAYNFDAESIRYVGLSIANKLPECLAAGVPVLAYGPNDIAALSTIVQLGCAATVCEREPALLERALRALVEDPARCRELGARGRRTAGSLFARVDVVEAFRSAICRAAHASTAAQSGAVRAAAAANPPVTAAAPAPVRPPALQRPVAEQQIAAPQIEAFAKTSGPVATRSANQLFRDGDYAAALQLSLALYRERRLAMDRGNALLAAKRLGRAAEVAQHLEQIDASTTL